MYKGRQPAAEDVIFIFSATANRKHWEPVSIVLGRQVIEQWQLLQEHNLRPVDLYAIAKMSLFESFDRSASGVLPSIVRPGTNDLSRYMDALGLL